MNIISLNNSPAVLLKEPLLQDKTVIYSGETSITVVADDEYNGLSRVTIQKGSSSGGSGTGGEGEICKLKINVITPPNDDPEWNLTILNNTISTDSEDITLNANNLSVEINIPSNGQFSLNTWNYIDSIETHNWGIFDYNSVNTDYIAQSFTGPKTYICFAADMGIGTWNIEFRQS